MSIVRAIDLGYGAVKFTVRSPSNGANVVCRTFPSVAVATTPASQHSGDLVLPRLEVVDIVTDAGTFMVGPQAHMLLSETSGRSQQTEYWKSGEYHALMLAALHYVGEKRIDELVLGLPLSTYSKTSKEGLKARYTGRVLIPRRDPAHSQELEIANVHVMPQPLGGYMSCYQLLGETSDSRNTLIIDPGFFTVDFAVLTPQRQPIMERSDALHGGMSRIYRAIAKSLKQSHGKTLTDVTPIEQALRHGTPLQLSSGPVDLEQFSDETEALVRGTLQELFAHANLEREDIGRIVLLGGGAKLFAKVIATMTPLPILSPREPAFANVEGFQMAGEARVAMAATLSSSKAAA